MNWLIFHIASGAAFFTGIAFIAIAAGLGLWGKDKSRRWATLPCLIGVIVVAFSATPLPYAAYGFLAVATIGWMIAARAKSVSRKKLRWASALFLGIWIVAAAVELPYHVVPTVPAEQDETVIIYADSITAGMGDGEAETWPNLLKRTKSADINDRSNMGATVRSVLAKVEEDEKNDIAPGIVILEIGGNDLLGGTSSAEFERDRLLGLLARRHQAVLMFELPLPPTYNVFGMIQRRLAAEHYVTLIPKRVLMGVLSGSGATLDSIHLTQRGHDEMAAIVWGILGRDE